MPSDVNTPDNYQSILPKAKFTPATSIALLLLVSAAVLVTLRTTAAWSQSTNPNEAAGAAPLSLPALGNTDEADRQMLREISDEHVHDATSHPAAVKVSTIKPSPSDNDLSAHPGSNSVHTVWQLVRQSRRLKIPANDQIESYKDQYRREALWITKILERATPYIGHIVDELDARFLPIELALLPAIESGFQPDVLSTGNAAGIWQIVPITAREIGIERSAWFDGRADIIVSTTAAIDYLSYLNAEFHGDWLLTLAAYNAGPGRVRGAVRKNVKSGQPTDFWSLSLPDETRNYIPKFLALVSLLREADVDSLEIPPVAQGAGFEIIDIGARISIDKAAQLAKVPEPVLRRLNAGLMHGVTSPGGPHKLYFPVGTTQELRRELARADRKRLYSLPVTHTVVAGDTVSSIALKYGIRQQRLRDMNGLDGSHIMIGQQLAVRDNKFMRGERMEYVVTIGDTLSAIAERFSVRLGDITDSAGKPLSTDIIHPGERLSIAVRTVDSG